MIDRDSIDIDGTEDVYTGSEWPAPRVTERRSPLRAAALGALYAVVVICGLIILSWSTGWMAREVSELLP